MDSTTQENSSGANMAELDAPLHAFGFQIEELSPSRLTGRLLITPTCCQPFKVLHGGVSALVAEALANMGAHMASDFRRVAGVQLSINHFRSAAAGDTVLAQAVPVHVGRSTQAQAITYQCISYGMTKMNLWTPYILLRASHPHNACRKWRK